VLLVGWFAARWSSRAILRAALKLPPSDQTVLRFVSRVVRIAIWVLSGVAAAGQLGLPLTSFLALMGAIGLGVGLALKGTLSDLASGIVLLILRPFAVGDAVEIAGSVGIVKDVGLFAVKLRQFDGIAVVLPNSNVWGSRIVNMVSEGTRRVEIPVGVAYATDLDRAFEVLRATLVADPRVLADPEPMVVADAFADSSINLLARCWVPAEDWAAVRSDLFRAVHRALHEASIEIPFPQRDVWHRTTTPEAG
jgi:small conductance mechanosensitive channel